MVPFPTPGCLSKPLPRQGIFINGRVGECKNPYLKPPYRRAYFSTYYALNKV